MSKLADKFMSMADKLQDEILDCFDMNTSINTHRKLGMKEKQVRKGIMLSELQTVLRALSTCHKTGTVPLHLTKYTTKKALLTEIQARRIEQFKPMVALDEIDFMPPAVKIWLEEGRIYLTKIDSFFPTPRPLIDRMLTFANIESHDLVLEPSAGLGHIIEAVRDYEEYADIIGFEVNPRLHQLCLDKGFDVRRQDFMQVTTSDLEERPTKVIMNPPFEKGQDAEHIAHAYDLMSPGGRLVAIASMSLLQRTNKAYTAFRDTYLSDESLYQTIELGQAFKDGPRPTFVSVCMVVLDKPAMNGRIMNPKLELVPKEPDVKQLSLF